ncbi:hypothetical protein [Lactobacillus johnsonii]|uniref:hypothetical protein n=1 Tax=Lactobacillus johnsonii TaxID=33959 RepID=UPI0036684598
MNKKAITLLGMISAGLLLGGCSNGNSEKVDRANSVSQSKKSNRNEKVVKIDKTSNQVGPLKVHVSNIKYEKVENKESNWTDAEYNMEGHPKKDLNKYYYRAIVSLKFENTGDKSVDLSYGERTYTVDDGTAFPIQSGANGSSFESSVAKIAPHGKLAETVILISNNKFTANKLQVTFTDICENMDTTLSEGGTAKI